MATDRRDAFALIPLPGVVVASLVGVTLCSRAPRPHGIR